MQIKERNIGGKLGFQIDNFYSHPEWVFNHICSTPPQYHGTKLSKSNGKYYHDMRHKKVLHELDFYLDDICNQVGFIKKNGKETTLYTNFMMWENDLEYNDYKNNYWYPHYDTYYTMILYLNPTQKQNGTNIYQAKDDFYNKVQSKHLEHYRPWWPKENYEVIDYLEPVFNRAYIFNSKDLLHGAAVDDETYFGNLFRLNQVVFFDENRDA